MAKKKFLYFRDGDAEGTRLKTLPEDQFIVGGESWYMFYLTRKSKNLHKEKESDLVIILAIPGSELIPLDHCLKPRQIHKTKEAKCV